MSTKSQLRLFQYRARRNMMKWIANAALTSRHVNPFATHLPILVALCTVTTIRHVVEFGSGKYSTLAFLHPDIFPELEKLVSFENDEEWALEMSRAVGDDPRCSIHYSDKPLFQNISASLLQRADLIFIDDSKTINERANTITTMTKHANNKSLIVIHDFEQAAYRNAAEDAPFHYRFRLFNPNTGVVWFDDKRFNRKKFAALERKLKRHSKHVDLEDALRWRRCLLNS